MRLCRFEVGEEVRCGRVEGSVIVEVAATDPVVYLASGGPDTAEHPLDGARLRAPIGRPPSIRDFYAFLEHAERAMARRGLAVPEAWFEEPRFYFSNPEAVIGPDDVVAFPPEAEEWDYELELAAVIGADLAVCGYTIMNDWSARDLQRREMTVGLGPAKGKDFATSFGPFLVTPDELGPLELDMVARVDGEVRTEANSRTLFHPWAAILEAAQRNTRLRPGDVIGSGTPGGGCILEHGDGRWLEPGSVVELEIAGLGVLRNVVGPVVPTDPSGRADPS